MNKLNTFLYCHDPLDEDSGEYILHLAHPSALIKIISLDEQEPVEGDDFITKKYTYEFEDDDTEEYQLVFINFTGAAGKINPLSPEEAYPVLDAAWQYWLQVLEVDEEDY